MTLAARIKQARNHRGWSQRKLAELMGISVQAISQWETGKTSPTYTNTLKLADILDVSTAWMYGETAVIDKKEVDESIEEDFYGPPELVADDQVTDVPLIDINDTIYFVGSFRPTSPGRTVIDHAIATQLEFKEFGFAILVSSVTSSYLIQQGDIAIFDSGIQPTAGDIALYLEIYSGGRHRVQLGIMEGPLDPMGREFPVKNILHERSDTISFRADLMARSLLAVLVEVRRHRMDQGKPWPSSFT